MVNENTNETTNEETKPVDQADGAGSTEAAAEEKPAEEVKPEGE